MKQLFAILQWNVHHLLASTISLLERQTRACSLSCRVLCCCGVVLVVSCVVLFLVCVCVCVTCFSSYLRISQRIASGGGGNMCICKYYVISVSCIMFTWYMIHILHSYLDCTQTRVNPTSRLGFTYGELSCRVLCCCVVVLVVSGVSCVVVLVVSCVVVFLLCVCVWPVYRLHLRIRQRIANRGGGNMCMYIIYDIDIT